MAVPVLGFESLVCRFPASCARYLEAGKQGTLALCIGRPWPEKYFGKAPWGFEPDYFHELIMYDEPGLS